MNNDKKNWLVPVCQDLHWFQLTGQIRTWGLGLVHLKVVLRQIWELFCLQVREFVVSSDPRSSSQTAKKPFILESHLTRWFLSLGLDTELILVDTSWHWVDTERLCQLYRSPVGGGWWRWHNDRDTMPVYNCQNCWRQPHIISSKNATACAVWPFYWTLGLRAEWPPYYTWTQQRIHTARQCQPLNSQYWALQFV